MSCLVQPWKLLFVILAGWVNQRQQEAISYLRTENQVLREKLGTRRILLNDDQRPGVRPVCAGPSQRPTGIEKTGQSAGAADAL